ncbi:MAG: thiamine-phosphate kinase [Gammaproteobacteria bacterium]|nr:MAG: thiamine-phosphate kinase [Gammaproteobacteria bacterium]RKZ44507.1 MAG: thiamine-phosphate kinase [Gammaproteobacteria bacterium]RKZ74491.1 MAG: thiamine-phosphate kinase [Gammaproteobacteria bacterium]
MPIAEFDVIARYFTQAFPKRTDVILGIGDDAALCTVPAGMQLAIAVDTLVEGVHFPRTTCAQDMGYKALAVNLSDMAAMGATPAWMTLALTCPQTDGAWLKGFTQGLLELAKLYQVSLMGGDTTCGPLTITIQIAGFVPPDGALQRCGAQQGDGIYVTGTLGDAGLGLASIQKQVILPSQTQQFVESRLNRPTPRVAEGQALRGIASSAIDISDGLAADLGHILEASGVGASLQLEKLPLSRALIKHLSPEKAWLMALSAGDDYELCFTVPHQKEVALQKALPNYTRIGIIESSPGLRCLDAQGQLFRFEKTGYQHF